MSDNVKFEAELLDTAHLNPYVQVMLNRECINFATTFAGEWLANIERLEEHGFTVDEEGELVCGRKHFKEGAGKLGKFVNFANLMAVGEAISNHMAFATHQIEPDNAPFLRMGRSGCAPDCPTHAHTHYHKIVGDD